MWLIDKLWSGQKFEPQKDAKGSKKYERSSRNISIV
jgi:hypothetical protein